MKSDVVMAVLICTLAPLIAQMQEKQHPFNDPNVKTIAADEISVPSDCVCGILSNAESGQPIPQMLLELKPFSVKFETPHVSAVTVQLSKAVKSSRSGLNGDFDLGGAKPGQYVLRVNSSQQKGWVNVRVLRKTGEKQCNVRLRLNTSDNSIVSVQQPQ